MTTTRGKLSIPSMQDRCSPAEWHARVDLAACYRLVDLYGMSDMMANHISSHVPGEPGAFLINAYGTLEAQLIRDGADPVGGSAEQFGRFTQQEFEKWRTIVRDSGATVE